MVTETWRVVLSNSAVVTTTTIGRLWAGTAAAVKLKSSE